MTFRSEKFLNRKDFVENKFQPNKQDNKNQWGLGDGAMTAIFENFHKGRGVWPSSTSNMINWELEEYQFDGAAGSGHTI